MFSPPDGPELPRSGSRERRLVLLVDDCQDTRELYAEYLELSGFDVKEADDGIVAIDEAVRVRPDIIVMDMTIRNWRTTTTLLQMMAGDASPSARL